MENIRVTGNTLKILDRKGLKSIFKLILKYIKDKFDYLEETLKDRGIYIGDKDIDYLPVKAALNRPYLAYFTRDRVINLIGKEDTTGIDFSKVKYKVDIVIGVDFSQTYNQLLYESYEFSGENYLIHIPKDSPFFLTKLIDNDYPISDSKGYEKSKDKIDWSKNLIIRELDNNYSTVYHRSLAYNFQGGKYPGWTAYPIQTGKRFKKPDVALELCLNIYKYLKPKVVTVLNDNTTIFKPIQYDLNLEAPLLNRNSACLVIDIKTFLPKANRSRFNVGEVGDLIKHVIQDILTRVPTLGSLVLSAIVNINLKVEPLDSQIDSIPKLFITLQGNLGMVGISDSKYLIGKIKYSSFNLDKTDSKELLDSFTTFEQDLDKPIPLFPL